MPIPSFISDLLNKDLAGSILSTTTGRDGTTTLQVAPEKCHDLLATLRARLGARTMLHDLTGIDERGRRNSPQRTQRTQREEREEDFKQQRNGEDTAGTAVEHIARTGMPRASGTGATRAGDFSVVYHIVTLDTNRDVRVKAPLAASEVTGALQTVCDLWPNADWYERELWDMFGVAVSGHKNLKRILCPAWWQGHALRKDHPARATEMAAEFTTERIIQMEESLTWPDETETKQQQQRRGRDALETRGQDVRDTPDTPDTPEETMVLNLGPHHPGTHGVLRLVCRIQGERLVEVIPEIGFHHRGAEKMGERQSWHTYIPYTDRVDYLAGVINELPYVLSVEALAGIDVPARAKVMRVMLCELFRIISHLVWLGTFTLDLGAMSPTFYIFTDREKALDIITAITGARMHPGFFRIGGLADDLPQGWDKMFREFLDMMPAHLREYESMMMKNSILKARTVGIGEMTTDEAIAWGVTGPNLRATGLAWDWRKKRPYSGYEQFEFDIPTASRGDCYDRANVRMEEMRQSLRIIDQCVRNMPSGEHKSRSPLATPPLRPRTLQDIETLITHFLGVTWGPVIPPGEAAVFTEGAKGSYSYYLISDGGTSSYRTRIRTASFPHIQALPQMCNGTTISDLIAVLGSIDFVLADIDR